MAEIFRTEDIRKLLWNKFVIVIGGSVMRGTYKDLVHFLQHDTYISQSDLKRKGEESSNGDELIEGGTKGEMSNKTHYREIRQYQTDTVLLRFYFITQVYNQYFETIVEDLLHESSPKPDIIMMNSCLWDMTRYGPRWLLLYRKNMDKMLNSIKIVAKDSLFMWLTCMPVGKRARGGFLPRGGEWRKDTLRLDVLEANFFSSQAVIFHGFDVLDLNYDFRDLTHLRVQDDIHWLPEAHRRMTNLILGHICLAWNLPRARHMRPLPDMDFNNNCMVPANRIGNLHQRNISAPAALRLQFCMPMRRPFMNPNMCRADYPRDHVDGDFAQDDLHRVRNFSGEQDYGEMQNFGPPYFSRGPEPNVQNFGGRGPMRGNFAPGFFGPMRGLPQPRGCGMRNSGNWDAPPNFPMGDCRELVNFAGGNDFNDRYSDNSCSRGPSPIMENFGLNNFNDRYSDCGSRGPSPTMQNFAGGCGDSRNFGGNYLCDRRGPSPTMQNFAGGCGDMRNSGGNFGISRDPSPTMQNFGGGCGNMRNFGGDGGNFGPSIHHDNFDGDGYHNDFGNDDSFGVLNFEDGEYGGTWNFREGDSGMRNFAGDCGGPMQNHGPRKPIPTMHSINREMGNFPRNDCHAGAPFFDDGRHPEWCNNPPFQDGGFHFEAGNFGVDNFVCDNYGGAEPGGPGSRAGNPYVMKNNFKFKPRGRRRPYAFRR